MSIPSNNSQQQPVNVERPDMTAVFAQLKEKVPEKATEGDLESRTVTVIQANIQAKKPEQLHKSDMGAGAADMEAQAVFQKIKETASQPLPEPNRFARWVVSMGERSPIKKLFLSVFSGLRTLNTETNKIKGAQSQAVEENKLILKEAEEHIFELKEKRTVTEFKIKDLLEAFKTPYIKTDDISLEKIPLAISDREQILEKVKKRRAEVEDTRDNIIAKGVSNTDDTKVGLNNVIRDHEELIRTLEGQIKKLKTNQSELGFRGTNQKLLEEVDEAFKKVSDLDNDISNPTINNPRAFEKPIRDAFACLTPAINIVTDKIKILELEGEDKDLKIEGLQKIKTELEAKKIELQVKQAILKFTAENKELVESTREKYSSFQSSETPENAKSFFRAASETISKLDADIGALGGASDPRAKELIQLKSELEAKLSEAVGAFSGNLTIVLKDDSGNMRLNEDFGKFDGVFNRNVFVAQYDAQLKAYSDAGANPIEINRFKELTMDRWDENIPEIKTISDLVENSKVFLKLAGRTAFPTEANLAENIAGDNLDTQAEMIKQMQGTRPIATQQTFDVAERFLNFKKENGNNIEKKLYKDMTTEQFINRLIQKRDQVMYLGSDDRVSRTGRTVRGEVDKVGTDEEAFSTLENHMSYEEIEIAALLGVSTETPFINDGNRGNRGNLGESGKFIEKGIIQGVVGARFEPTETKREVMEFKYCVVTKRQNTEINGYGENNTSPTAKFFNEVWTKFHGVSHFCTFDEAEKHYNDIEARAKQDPAVLKEHRFIKTTYNGETIYLDKVAYKARMRASIESSLTDANERAKLAGKKAYVHAVGLGIGVWALGETNKPMQANLMTEVYEEVLRDGNFEYISDINFAYFPGTTRFGSDEQVFSAENPGTYKGVKIQFSTRNPGDLFVGEDEGKLLVEQFAWDGASMVGNEYWKGALAASGDPAAACHSAIPQFANPHINKWYGASGLFLSNLSKPEVLQK